MSTVTTKAEYEALIRETLTQEQIDLMLSCKPGERFVVRGNDLLKVSEAALVEDFKGAIFEAIGELLTELGVTCRQEVARHHIDWKIYSPELKVTLSLIDGRQGSRTKTLPSPRGMN